MTLRQATIYLLWYGEKAIAGDSPTEEEFEKFKEARAVSLYMAHKMLRIKPEEYEYRKGQSYR